jgi:hypothetical protein
MSEKGTRDDLRRLYDTVLAPRLAALERDRLALKHAIVASALLVGVPFVMAFCGGADVLALALPGDARPWIGPAIWVALAVGVAIAVSKHALPGVTAYMSYRVRFKREVVAEIVRAVSPGSAYEPFSYIKPDVFEQNGLFEKLGEVTGDDLVRGRMGEIPFEACEMDRHYSTGGKNSHTVSVFHGLFFRLDFNKRIHGRTIVQPQKPEGISLASRRDLAHVTLENPEFESAFEVFASDPVEARYILTPVLMERILDIRRKTGRTICLAFVDNRAFVAIDYGRALFEPSIRETTSFEALAEMAGHFQLAALVVQELDLNTRIWTKDVDASLLEEAPAASPLSALSTGDLTAERLLTQASRALYIDADVGPSPERPARTRTNVEREGDVTIVRYRFAWWALVCMALSLPFAAVAAAGISMMVAPEWTLAELWPILGAPPEAAEVFRASAWIAIGVGIVIGGFFGLYWITYVRQVTIDADEIRVKRGVSPFARRYARSDQTRILQMDQYLFLGRAGALKIINPSLSPMLCSQEEARWVAWQMRQALEQSPAPAALGTP